MRDAAYHCTLVCIALLSAVQLLPQAKAAASDHASRHRHILRRTTPEKAGFDPIRLAAVDTILWNAIRDSAFPAAVLLIARDGMIVHDKAYGTLGYAMDTTRTDTATLFDIASLTKIIATTTACMRLIDEKKIGLNTRVASFLPAFVKGGKRKITIKNLLMHDSGLPAWKPFYLSCHDPESMLDSICSIPLCYRTGDSSVYSDLGFIVLGMLIEKVTGVSLDRYVDSVFFTPLGMKSTMYNPPRSAWRRIAPTAVDTAQDGTLKILRGSVHDENAAAIGGVSGHAGLFSTASDLAVMLEMIRNGGEYGGKRYLSKHIIGSFTRRQSAVSTRALGWDTKKPDHSWAGDLMSEKAFIHTGFTGTSVVIDPSDSLIVVLLTNRVFPSRANGKISAVRPALHDAILRALK